MNHPLDTIGPDGPAEAEAFYQSERDRLDNDLDELQRFREREPLVRALCGAVEDHPYGDVAPIDAWRVLVDWEMEHRISSATETLSATDDAGRSDGQKTAENDENS